MPKKCYSRPVRQATNRPIGGARYRPLPLAAGLLPAEVLALTARRRRDQGAEVTPAAASRGVPTIRSSVLNIEVSLHG